MSWFIVIVFVSGEWMNVSLREPMDEAKCNIIARELRASAPANVKSVSCSLKGKSA
jgi:hypothetical protein